MSNCYSLIGVSQDGRKTTICVHVQPENEARRLARRLEKLDDFVRIDVVAESEPTAPGSVPEASKPERVKVIFRRKARRPRRKRKTVD